MARKMNPTEGSRSESKKKEGGHKLFRVKRILQWSAGIAAAGIVVVLVLFIIVSVNPYLGAEGADWLRNIIGDKAVAGLEMVVFQVQDVFQRWEYQLGILNPAGDFGSFPSPTASPPLALRTNTPRAISATETPNKTRTVTPTPTTPLPWQPVTLSPLGLANGEGIWLSYIQDTQGRTVAYKTFLQPDPSRPYTLVTIVAVDLTQTRLHYVLGAIDPTLPGAPPHSGNMPAADRVANILLAEFNGGFKARHGQFGAMADGVQALPPRDGLGTLVIYQNGDVLLGEWGTDVFMSPEIASFRQNGPLVISKGEINPRIYNNSPQDWGYTVIDVSPTVRSGVGLSRDNKTLYYFCGPSLTMEALAKSMQAAGAYNAIQLDINNYWVLFVKIAQSGPKLSAEPLLPRLMVGAVDRYLTQSPRDFFYLTGLVTK
jgi:Phosphodiester glycosidase